MKILLWTRSDCFKAKGGDMVQVENTLIELKKLNIDVTVSDKNNVNLEKFDIVHLFQLDWTPETYLHAKKVKKAGKKLILSPIHHNIEEVKKFDDEYAFGLRRVSKILFTDQFHRDTFKNIYRSILDKNKVVPTLYSLFLGLKKMNKKAIELSDYVLTQTELEANDLEKLYRIKFDWEVIPNGVSENFLNPKELKNLFPFEDYIVSVGRIEPRKNNLNLIAAVKELRKDLGEDLKLVFVGKKSNKHAEYTDLFDMELKENSWIKFVDYINYSQMPSIYKYAKVCASTSWFETTGLTLLEALFMNTNAVSTSPRAKEILGDLCSYCSPNDIKSIKLALKNELIRKRPVLPNQFKKEFTWENTAKKTLEIYEKVLNG
jgi:glycosyltransferase involved in cell wall biosynthesis